ncbi:BMP family ABC transporter substrate-binding protein [Kurthia zopfii]|uniref:Nucleoside-binding protein n=1 Tax=Kurthia zopfii TaxID=1650 RepID=A0A2U3AE45_9BACL|nr:BMP family protein [Kurthia zopfii]PWI22784.1 BMP family ABC transporter substrate-binding protein [Kurthia zopfii]TDR41825.1 nucleoside-binding protein [Kurthia zopfii]STX09136.1 Purine nucleoside receptor A [Kurthia zopfii]VEI04649.1 Purine nucleoside receptor A [Kurthia zopfii]
MKKRNLGLALSAVLASGTLLAACGSDDAKKDDKKGDKDAFSVAMVTDTGGIDDKSFNQSTWEGIQAFGKENGMTKGNGGFDYLQSKQDSDFTTNINNLVRRDFDLVFAVGFKLHDSVEQVAKQQKDAKLAIIDEVVEGHDNVTSIMFKANEASFLAGVAAALESKTDKVGFIGGMEGAVIGGFQAGFEAGVKAANPKVKVDVQYAGSFGDAAKGQTIAKRMYDSGADIIFHAAGGTGNGLFTEAKERKKKDAKADVWAIGVDRDQYDEGKVGDTNIVMTSVLKRVDIAAKDVSKLTKDGKFPGGKTITYGLKDNGVDLADSHGAISEKTMKKVEEFKAKIVSGDVKVPELPAKK